MRDNNSLAYTVIIQLNCFDDSRFFYHKQTQQGAEVDYPPFCAFSFSDFALKFQYIYVDERQYNENLLFRDFLEITCLSRFLNPDVPISASLCFPVYH